MGELLHEENMWAVLIMGGSLSFLNVFITSFRIERYKQQSVKETFENVPRSENNRENQHRTQIYAGDSVSIDVNSLSDHANQQNYQRLEIAYSSEDVKEVANQRRPRRSRSTYQKEEKRKKTRGEHISSKPSRKEENRVQKHRCKHKGKCRRDRKKGGELCYTEKKDKKSKKKSQRRKGESAKAEQAVLV